MKTFHIDDPHTMLPRLSSTILLGGLAFAAFSPKSALAQCSASGALTSGSTVTCNGSQTTTVGQGPGANNISVTVNDGATVAVSNNNSISLGSNATVTLGSSGPTAGGSASNAAVLVQTTTNGSASGGQYGDGSNTIDVGSNSLITINRNASVIATGTQQESEAINPYGSGNTIVNYGLIQGGPSSAVFFQNVGSNAASPRNVLDNFGTIQLLPVGSVNPVTGSQAVGSDGAVGVDFINESGAKVIGNLVFQDGDDRVTLNPGSTISGDMDGGGGNNLLTLNASGTSSDTFAGQVINFQTLDKTGTGTWTLSGAIGDNIIAGATPLAVNIMGGTLVLTGNNALFDGSIAINPGGSATTPGPDPTATLEARAQSLPPLITDHGVLLLDQYSPDGIQSADGTYAGLIQGTGVVTKIGNGTVTLSAVNTYSGGTNLNIGALAVAADTALGAASGSLTFNGGTLRLLSSFNVSSARSIVLNGSSAGLAGGGTIDTNGFQTTIAQAVSGAGGLTKAGIGDLTLTAANAYAGGTTIGGGTLQLGNGGATGSILGDVADNGILAFNRSDIVTFPGVISGTGAVAQAGAGATILNAQETYTGATDITSGTLAVGDSAHSAALLSGGGAVAIASGATLGGYGGVAGNVTDAGVVAAGNALAVFTGGTTGTFTIGGALVNQGGINLAGSGIGNALAVHGNYTGAGGTLTLNTLLNAGGPLSNQTTDRLLIGGNASGGTVVQVNGSGAGASTGLPLASSGISIIQVAGSSAANAFTLSGGYVTNGTPFQYHLIAYGPSSANGSADASQNLVGNPTGYTDYRLQTPYVTPSGPVAVTPVTAPVVTPVTVTAPVVTPVTVTAPVITPVTVTAPVITPVTVTAPVITPVTITAPVVTPVTVTTPVVTPVTTTTPAVTPVTTTTPAVTPATTTISVVTPATTTIPVVTPATTTTPAVATATTVATAVTTTATAATAVAATAATVTTAAAAQAVTVPPNARPEVAPQVPAYITAPTALFNAGFQDLDSLHRRLGEIRDDQSQERGQNGEMFMRALGGRFNYSSDRSFTAYGFDSSQDYAATQFGANWTAIDNEDGVLRTGIAVTIGRLWFEPNAVDGASNGKFSTETLAAIATWQSSAGWYADAIVSGGLFDGDITTPARRKTTSMNGTSMGASIEVGYPIPLNWYGAAIEPQAQLVYQRLDFARKTDIDSVDVNPGSPDQGVFRGGARLTKQIAGTDGTLYTPYLKANVLQGIGGGDSVEIGNVAFGTGRFGTAFQFGAGVTATPTNNLSIYGDAAWQTTAGGGGSRGWALNGGLRFAF